MQNTIKLPTILWLLAAFAFSPLSPIPSYNPLETAVRFIGAALFAYFAYLTYRKGLTAAEAVETPPRAPLLTPQTSKIAAIGAGIGFAAGYLTRPEFMNPNTFSRQKVSLDILFKTLNADYAYLKADLLTHLLVATALGAVAAVVLERLLAPKKAA